MPAGAWLGMPVLLGGLALHAAGELFFIDWLSEISLLPALAGLCLCVGGWQLGRLAAPSVAFLVFMLPLPYFVEVALANPLQRVGTIASTYLLQLIGLTATAEGNIIVMNHGPIEVAEACSGLAMLMTFFALTTAVAIVVRRPWLDKVVIFVSAVPIAVAANVIRITLTGILYETSTTEVVRLFYHDAAGLLMMTFGLLILWGEMWLWSRLIAKAPEETLAPADIGDSIGLVPVAVPKNGVRVADTAASRKKAGAIRI